MECMVLNQFNVLDNDQLELINGGFTSAQWIVGTCTVVGAVVGTVAGGGVCGVVGVKAGSAAGIAICSAVGIASGYVGTKIGDAING